MFYKVVTYVINRYSPFIAPLWIHCPLFRACSVCWVAGLCGLSYPGSLVLWASGRHWKETRALEGGEGQWLIHWPLSRPGLSPVTSSRELHHLWLSPEPCLHLSLQVRPLTCLSLITHWGRGASFLPGSQKHSSLFLLHTQGLKYFIIFHIFLKIYQLTAKSCFGFSNNHTAYTMSSYLIKLLTKICSVAFSKLA